MMGKLVKLAGKGCTVSLFVAALLLSAQQPNFDGTWQMDTAKSHVNDGRVVTLTIATSNDAIKMTFQTRKKDGQEVTSEFTSKLSDGKACEFAEGIHKSQLTVWYDGPTLNASKEKGPADDVTSGWKFELSPDTQTVKMTINHYEPAAEDETLVFTKKRS